MSSTVELHCVAQAVGASDQKSAAFTGYTGDIGYAEFCWMTNPVSARS